MIISHRTSHLAAQHSDSSEGGGYLASTADLMIGLLFIFIILVVILAVRAGSSDSTNPDSTSPSDPRKALVLTLGSGLTGVHPGIRIDQDTGVISLPEELLFASGSSDLTLQGKDLLQRAANDFGILLRCFVSNQKQGYNCNKRNPENHQVETIFIEGHTDSIPFASGAKDNIDLSLDRARAVEKVLVSDTLKSFRNVSGQPIFAMSAYGESRPLKGRSPEDAANRRVDLRFIMQYKSIEDMRREMVPVIK